MSRMPVNGRWRKSFEKNQGELSSIEDRGQTDRVTTPTRAGLSRSSCLDRATPHASRR